jgi:hypothetical protein
VTAAYLTLSPTIDGDLGDWTSTAYSADDVVFGASAWSGASDVSATYYIGWDTSNLYLGVRVTDDTFVQISKGATMYKGDVVELSWTPTSRGTTS